MFLFRQYLVAPHKSRNMCTKIGPIQNFLLAYFQNLEKNWVKESEIYYNFYGNIFLEIILRFKGYNNLKYLVIDFLMSFGKTKLHDNSRNQCRSSVCHLTIAYERKLENTIILLRKYSKFSWIEQIFKSRKSIILPC